MSKQIEGELKFEITGIAIVALATFIFVGFFTSSVGAVGNFLSRLLVCISGEGRYFIPVFLFLIGFKLMQEGKRITFSAKIWGVLLLFVVVLILLHLPFPQEDIIQAKWQGEGGGAVGAFISFALKYSFGTLGSYIVTSAAGLVAIMLLFTDISLKALAILVLKRGVEIFLKCKQYLYDFLTIPL